MKKMLAALLVLTALCALAPGAFAAEVAPAQSPVVTQSVDLPAWLTTKPVLVQAPEMVLLSGINQCREFCPGEACCMAGHNNWVCC